MALAREALRPRGLKALAMCMASDQRRVTAWLHQVCDSCAVPAVDR